MQKRNAAVITCSSSHIRYQTARLLTRSGFHTYASVRSLEKSKNIAEIANREKLPLEIVQLDFNDERSVKDAIGKIEDENRVGDVPVNNAGCGLFGSLEDLSIEEIKAKFETNFFGVPRLTQKAIPIMRKQSSDDTIVNVSSVGGRMGVPGLSAYQSTKFALEGLIESLSYELEPFKIRVVINEPGFIRTDIMNSRILAKKSADPKSPYFSLIQKVENHFR